MTVVIDLLSCNVQECVLSENCPHSLALTISFWPNRSVCIASSCRPRRTLSQEARSFEPVSVHKKELQCRKVQVGNILYKYIFILHSHVTDV